MAFAFGVGFVLLVGLGVGCFFDRSSDRSERERIVPVAFARSKSVSPSEKFPADVRYIQTILEDHCIDCHGSETAKADLRLDGIDWNDLSVMGEDLQEALEQVILMEMPPAKKSKLGESERAKFHALLTDKLRRFHSENREPAAFVPAKLNRAQFVHTLEDLLSVRIPENLVASLPGDKSGDPSMVKHLFSNNRKALSFSLLQFELYKGCIEEALEQAIPDEQPKMSPFRSYRFDFSVVTEIRMVGKNKDKEQKIERLVTQGKVMAEINPPDGYVYNLKELIDVLPVNKKYGVDGVVNPKILRVGSTKISGRMKLQENGIMLPPLHSRLEHGRVDVHILGPNVTFVLPEIRASEGVYRLRVFASKGDDQREHPKLAVFSGPISYFRSGQIRSAGPAQVVDTPKGERGVYDFYCQLNEKPAERTRTPGQQDWPLGFLLRNEVFGVDGEQLESPLLHIKSVELDGPYYKHWPTPRERNIFPVRQESESEPDYARRVIDRFLIRAFRGDVSQEIRQKYFTYWKAARDNGDTFRQSIRVTVKTILLSPYFLYIDADAAKNKNQETATRLAYFLWHSPPTAELLQRAKNPDWNAADELNYMLAHPQFSRFMHAFAGEWLQLKKKPDHLLRGRMISAAMNREPAEFLKYLFQKNRSLENLIDSDFLVLNDTLAKWYGIEKPQGQGFGYVKLPADSSRGGVLTMSAPLTSHSKEYGVSDPIARGVWLCERILGRHLPPPPMNVEFPNPDDFEGFEKLTISEQLKFHQENPACYGCHHRIDPLGLPLENFDGYGLWREENYRYEIIGRRPPSKISFAKSDARSSIKGDSVNGIIEFKALLNRKYKDEILHSFTEFLYAYAAGRSVRASEAALIDDMHAQFKASGYKPRTLLEQILKTHALTNPRENQ